MYRGVLFVAPWPDHTIDVLDRFLQSLYLIGKFSVGDKSC